jgi:putative FmdB family regulatory protein
VPIHDFQCRGCGHAFEALVRPNQADPTACPSCGKTDLEKKLSVVAVTSREKRQQAANRSRAKQAATARRDNVAIEKEIERHRIEDH